MFVCFGIYGGLERQDYYLGYWRFHRSQLVSIVEQLPGLKDNANLIFYVPPCSPYLVTEAEYLARSWMSYLYNDPFLSRRVFLWSWDRKTQCLNEVDGFLCDEEGGQQKLIPYDKSVLLMYSLEQNRFLLQNTIPEFLLTNASFQPKGYDPHAQIVNGFLPTYSHSILYRPEYLASLYPDKGLSMDEQEIPLSKYEFSKLNENLWAGNVDILEPDIELSLIGGSKFIHVAGWAFDPHTNEPAKAVFMVDNGKPLISIPVNILRRDVAIALKNRSLSKTGWEINFPVEKLGSGQHRLEFHAMLSDSSLVSLISWRGLRHIDINIDFVKKLKEKEINEVKSSIPGLKKLPPISLPLETKNITYFFDIFNQEKNSLEIRGWAFINDKSSENSLIQISLSSDKNSYLINTIFVKRPDVTAHFKSLNVDDSGFSLVIAKEEIEIGKYKLGIYIKKDNIEAFQYTDRVIKIER